MNIVRSKVSTTTDHQISLSLSLSLSEMFGKIFIDNHSRASRCWQKTSCCAKSHGGNDSHGMNFLSTHHITFYQRITSQTIASHFLIKFVDDWPPNSNPWNTLVACPLAPHCDKRDLLHSHETQPLHFHTNQRWYRWSATPWHETIIVEFFYQNKLLMFVLQIKSIGQMPFPQRCCWS